jgi:hypothetical protein
VKDWDLGDETISISGGASDARKSCAFDHTTRREWRFENEESEIRLKNNLTEVSLRGRH